MRVLELCPIDAIEAMANVRRLGSRPDLTKISHPPPSWPLPAQAVERRRDGTRCGSAGGAVEPGEGHLPFLHGAASRVRGGGGQALPDDGQERPLGEGESRSPASRARLILERSRRRWLSLVWTETPLHRGSIRRGGSGGFRQPRPHSPSIRSRRGFRLF